MHIMDYVNTATTGTLLPHSLPTADLKQMLCHIEESLPTTMHLPVSSEDTLHFYRYLHICSYCQQTVLLLTDVPYSGSDAANINLQNIHLRHPSWKFYSMLRS